MSLQVNVTDEPVAQLHEIPASPRESADHAVGNPRPSCPADQRQFRHDVVAQLRQRRTQLAEEWARRIAQARLLTGVTNDEILTECGALCDSWLLTLETGSEEARQAYALDLLARIVPQDGDAQEVVAMVLLLRDVAARSLFATYRYDEELLNRVLDVFEPEAACIVSTVSLGVIEERGRAIFRQQEALRELPTPMLRVRENILVMPVIGNFTPHHARQVTEQALEGIRANRAAVVVMDFTLVPAMNAAAVGSLMQTAAAAKLLGTDVLVTGLLPRLARALIHSGIQLNNIMTADDLQAGINMAERLLGYEVVPVHGFGSSLATDHHDGRGI